MLRRVVITGIGTVACLGTGREALWEGLLAGRCGVGPVQSFRTEAYAVHRGAEVRDFRAADHVVRLDPERLGRTSQFAVAAARLALGDAGLATPLPNPSRVGVSLGTTSGEPRVIERFDDDYLAGSLNGSDLVERYPCHVIAGHVAAELQVSGPNAVLPAACAAGNCAIAHAFECLRAGRADLMLAGGADSFSRITFAGFSRLGAIAPEACQPFDRRRKGMIPGEGAALLVLEGREAAARRGGQAYAEVVGYGLSCDAHHMTGMRPDADGAVRAMRQALAAGGLGPADVDYISAHGTGTPTNDRVETLALKKVFGPAIQGIPVSSIKSMVGHAMGAASALEAAVCALAVCHDRIPPTINLREADPECDLDYVPNQARAHRVRVALNNAYGFGGTNASLVLRKCEG
jgi:3-oxoacyl-[acyl-carrier-protein] synthase II